MAFPASALSRRGSVTRVLSARRARRSRTPPTRTGRLRLAATPSSSGLLRLDARNHEATAPHLPAKSSSRRNWPPSWMRRPFSGPATADTKAPPMPVRQGVAPVIELFFAELMPQSRLEIDPARFENSRGALARDLGALWSWDLQLHFSAALRRNARSARSLRGGKVESMSREHTRRRSGPRGPQQGRASTPSHNPASAADRTSKTGQ